MNCHESKVLKANLGRIPLPWSVFAVSNVAILSISLGFSWMKSYIQPLVISGPHKSTQKNNRPASGITKATCSLCPPPKAQSTPKRWPPKKRCVKTCSAWPPPSPLEVMKSIPLWPLRLARQREGSTGAMPDDGRRSTQLRIIFSLFFEKQSIWSYDTQAWQGRVSWTIIIAANF